MNKQTFGWVTTVTLEISTDVRLTEIEAQEVHTKLLATLAHLLNEFPTSSSAFVDSDEDMYLYGEAHLTKCDDDDDEGIEDPYVDRYTKAQYLYKDGESTPLAFVIDDVFYGIGTEKTDSERETEEEA